MAKFKVVRPNMRLELKLRGLNLDSWTFLQQFLTLQEGMSSSPMNLKIVPYEDTDMECDGGEA